MFAVQRYNEAVAFGLEAESVSFVGLDLGVRQRQGTGPHGGKSINVQLKSAGGNMRKATGDFAATKGMKVILTSTKVGGQSFQARLAPLN